MAAFNHSFSLPPGHAFTSVQLCLPVFGKDLAEKTTEYMNYLLSFCELPSVALCTSPIALRGLARFWTWAAALPFSFPFPKLFSQLLPGSKQCFELLHLLIQLGGLTGLLLYELLEVGGCQSFLTLELLTEENVQNI